MAKKSLKKQRFSKKRSLTKRVQRKLSKKSKKRKTSRKNHKKTTHSRKMKGGSHGNLLQTKHSEICVLKVYNLQLKNDVLSFSRENSNVIQPDDEWWVTNVKKFRAVHPESKDHEMIWYVGFNEPSGSRFTADNIPLAKSVKTGKIMRDSPRERPIMCITNLFLDDLGGTNPAYIIYTKSRSCTNPSAVDDSTKKHVLERVKSLWIKVTENEANKGYMTSLSLYNT